MSEHDYDNPLVGHFFHSLVANPAGEHLPPVVQWQGEIISTPEPGWYLVQLFSWALGEDAERRLVRIEDMKNWWLYESADEMKSSYEALEHRYQDKDKAKDEE